LTILHSRPDLIRSTVRKWEARQGVDVEGVEEVVLVFGDLGALLEGAGGAGEGAEGDLVEIVAEGGPGLSGGGLGDPGE
jgi:hypothetical protein